MNSFIPHTQEQLKALKIQENKVYIIEYKNKDYFNGEETIEQTEARAMLNGDKMLFVVSDPYGMDKFVDNVKVKREKK